MITLFKIEIDVPKTKTTKQQTLVITSQDQAVSSVVCDMKKEEKRDLSFLEIKVRDYRGLILTSIPDPAFADIPMRFYMVEPGRNEPTLVWSGIVTRLAPKYPEEDLEIVGHDKSIKLRTNAKVRTLKKLTPVEAAKKIAAEYGLETDVDIGDLSLKARAMMMQFPGFGKESWSDWNFIKTMLASAGLGCNVHHDKLFIRQTAKELYPITFRQGDGRFVSFSCSMNHVHGPGSQGNVSNPPYLENTGTVKALTGISASIAKDMKGGVAITPRRLLGGATSSAVVSIEDVASPFANDVVRRQGRKDDGTLTLNPTPGVQLHHLVDIAGCSLKVDGKWEVMGVKHTLVPESDETTVLLLARGVSKATTAGEVAFEYKGVKVPK